MDVVNGIELGEFDINSFFSDVDSNEIVQQETSSHSKQQIIIAVDASNSMQGYKIGAVNDSVNNLLSKLRSYSRGQGADINIAVTGFSSRLFRWTNGFVPASDFKYSYVEMVDGLTDINALLEELIKLTEECMDPEAKKYVMLFSDGLPTDEYIDMLQKWTHTSLYKEINKIGVTFDDDIEDPQSMDFFESFTDNGTVLTINKQEELLAALMK